MNMGSACSWLLSRKNGTRLGGIRWMQVVCIVLAFLGGGMTCVCGVALRMDVSDRSSHDFSSSKAVSRMMTTCGGVPGYTMLPRNASTFLYAGFPFVWEPSGRDMRRMPCRTTTLLSWR